MFNLNNNLKLKIMADLMKKTKKELVDIILRKDDVEKSNATIIKQLRTELDDTKEAYAALEEKCQKLMDTVETYDIEKYNNLAGDVESYQKEIDEMTTTIHSYKAVLNTYKVLNGLFLLIALVMTVLYVLK